MLHSVVLVRTDVSEEFSASIIRVTRIGELATDACCEEELRQRAVVLLGGHQCFTVAPASIFLYKRIRQHFSSKC
jgi:hypothetical protein